jgi:anti-sigma regulatory factor (Ser/Thr protein kinase)
LAPHARQDLRLKLSLPARSEHLGTVRHALADFAASLGADDDLIANLRLAVNEACTNVVRHAYDGELAGALEVEAQPVGDQLVVVVQDTGRGLANASPDPGAGLGLRVASALSQSVEVRGRADGTEVKLAFPLGQAA